METMDYSNNSFDYDYSETMHSNAETKTNTYMKYMFIGAYSMVVLLGVPLNLLVIVTILHMKEKEKRVVWFFAMAVTDLMLCLMLPFYIVSAWEDYSWRFGTTLCKMTSYVIFMAMYSTAFILTSMSLTSLFSKMCASCRCIMSAIMLLLSWILSAVLAIPSLMFKAVQYKKQGEVCFYNYEVEIPGKVMTVKAMSRNSVVHYLPFLFGLMFPLTITIICHCLQKCATEKKCYRIERVVTAAYFLCWLPYHLIAVMQLNSAFKDSEMFYTIVLPVSTVLAVISGYVKPIIYFCMGKNLKWMNEED